MTSWPGGGFCTIVGCTGDCPGMHNICVASFQGQSYCAPSCLATGTCSRSGYACTGGGCLPAGDGG
jgi:hypothetical protein